MHSELTQTGRFARFVETFRYEQIPPDVVERTKDVIYDGIGALLSATSPKYDIGAVLSRFVRETGGGVRYQALTWGSIELDVRHRQDEGLGASTVMVRVNGVLETL